MKWILLLITFPISFVAYSCTNDEFIDYARKGSLGGVKKCVLDEKIDINFKSKNWRSQYGSALHLASGNGHLKVVKFLVSNRADINLKDKDGYTPLHRSVDNNKGSVAKVLIDLGADLYIKGKNGKTALGLAAKNLHILEMMISKGIDINDNEGNSSALIVAFISHNPEAFSYLIKNGANANSVNKGGRNILFSLRSNTKSMAERFEMASLAIKNGANINQKSEPGTTPIFSAAYGGGPEIVDFLIRAGANIKEKDNKGETVLFISNRRSVRTLVFHGLPIDEKNERGDTALHHAAWKCRFLKMEELLENGANVNAMNNFGLTPLSIVATRCKDIRSVEVLNVNSAKKDTLINLGRYKLYFESKKRPRNLNISLKEDVTSYELAKAYWMPHKNTHYKAKILELVEAFK